MNTVFPLPREVGPVSSPLTEEVEPYGMGEEGVIVCERWVSLRLRLELGGGKGKMV